MKCPNCRKEFEPVCETQRYCSKSCAKSVQQRGRRQRKLQARYQQHADNLKILDAVINRLEAIT